MRLDVEPLQSEPLEVLLDPFPDHLVRRGSAWARGFSFGVAASTRKRVVFGEVARLDVRLKPLGAGRGDVFVEAAPLATRIQDSLDGVVLECAKGQRVREGLEQVTGVIAFAQREDRTRVVAGGARLLFLESREEFGGGFSEVVEGSAQLIEIGAVFGMAGTVARQDRVLLRAAWQERVASDAGQVGLVDE